MQTAMILHGPDRVVRPRGRRLAPTIPAERAKHLAVACAHLIDGLSIAATAARFDCSPRSVLYWCRLAKQYPEGVALRRA